MKNRNIIMNRLEKAEGQVEKLHFYLKRGATREQVEEVLFTMKDVLQDTKSFVQQEPLGPGEINDKI